MDFPNELWAYISSFFSEKDIAPKIISPFTVPYKVHMEYSTYDYENYSKTYLVNGLLQNTKKVNIDEHSGKLYIVSQFGIYSYHYQYVLSTQILNSDIGIYYSDGYESDEYDTIDLNTYTGYDLENIREEYEWLLKEIPLFTDAYKTK